VIRQPFQVLNCRLALEFKNDSKGRLKKMLAVDDPGFDI
jgi:hypothetical protein